MIAVMQGGGAVALGMPTIEDIFDLENGIIHGPARKQELTNLELRLLAAFVGRRGLLCKRDYLVGQVWPEDDGPESAYDRAIPRLVDRLREQIERAGLNKWALRTRRELGYVLDVDKL